MRYQIKRGDEVVIEVHPVGVQQKGIMNANLVRFDFEASQPVNLRRGDHITVYREPYILNSLPPLVKDDKDRYVKYSYNCIFESIAYDLAKVSFNSLDANNNFTTGNFTITGTLDYHLNLVIRNANRIQTGWLKGVVDATETRTITYSNNKCLQVLAILASPTEFNTEWWVEGKTIHMTKKGKDSGLSLEYGKNKGLYSLERRPLDGANVVNRVYAEGGEKNIPSTYRNYSKRLQMPNGPYIESVAPGEEIIEHPLTFDEIYPNRIGTVSAAIDQFTFTDTNLDFDLNDYLLPGVTAKIVFNTGQLAGYQLEIASFQNEGKVFTINSNKDEKALEIPSDLIFAKPGDRYILIDINMPQEYIDLAEAELQTKAQEYLDQNKVDRFVYGGELDPIHFKRNGIVLKLGDYANIKDTELGVSVTPRLFYYERDLHEPNYYPKADFSEHVQIPAIVRQYAEQDKVNKIVLRSPLAKPFPTVTPVKTPVRHDIVLHENYSKSGDLFYWKDNNVVYFAGSFIQNVAEAPYIPFTMPLGYRPYYDTEARATVDIVQNMRFGFYSGPGTMIINRNGEVTIVASIPQKEIQSINIAKAQFYTGLG